jgi:WD40 repeat protein
MERLQSMSHTISRNVPLQVTATHNGQWVVLGGDDGFVRIYDGRTGQFLHRLDHGSGKQAIFGKNVGFLKQRQAGQLVQVIAANCNNRHGRIVTGSSDDGPSTIKIWSFIDTVVSRLIPQCYRSVHCYFTGTLFTSPIPGK